MNTNTIIIRIKGPIYFTSSFIWTEVNDQTPFYQINLWGVSLYCLNIFVKYSVSSMLVCEGRIIIWTTCDWMAPLNTCVRWGVLINVSVWEEWAYPDSLWLSGSFHYILLSKQQFLFCPEKSTNVWNNTKSPPLISVIICLYFTLRFSLVHSLYKSSYYKVIIVSVIMIIIQY